MVYIIQNVKSYTDEGYNILNVDHTNGRSIGIKKTEAFRKKKKTTKGKESNVGWKDEKHPHEEERASLRKILPTSTRKRTRSLKRCQHTQDCVKKNK